MLLSDGLSCGTYIPTPTEQAYLAANLSGGAAMMKFLYSTLGTVNVTGSVVDSVVDRLALGPNVVATTTARPQWDADLKIITGDGVNDRLAPSANNAAFDLTTIKAIVTVAVFNDAVPPSKYIASITESLSEARLLASANAVTDIVAIGGANPTWTAADTAVAKGASRRIVVASHDGGTTLTAQALSHTAVTAIIPALGAGNNRLTLLDSFPAAGENATGPWRATLGLNAEPTAPDLVVLATWGVTYHGASLAA